MKDYENSLQHDWDWNQRFPWPKWWSVTLPEIITDKRWRERYFWSGSPNNDIIVRIYQFLFKLKKDLIKD